jgi:PqqD family protein of HPr-rel-A system
VQGVELDGETVLYDERTGALHLLNSSASAVWWTIDGISCVGDIVTILAERFGVPAEAIRTDVQQLLGELQEAGLVLMR